MRLEHTDCSYRWAFTAKIQYAILISPAHCAGLACYKRTKLITRVKYTREVTLQWGRTLSIQALKCTEKEILVFILVINQLDAQNLFYNKFISCLYMFRAPCAQRQEVIIVSYSIWYHHTYRWPSRARDDDTRCCIIQLWPPDDEHMVLETCRGMK